MDNYIESSQKKYYNTFIIFLIIVIIFIFFGINVFHIIGDFIQNVVKPSLENFYIFCLSILSKLGYTTGTVINTVSDTSNKVLDTIGDDIIYVSEYKINEPNPDTSNSVIQQNNSKNNWCFVGSDSNKNSCFELSENQQCLSQITFNDKNSCMKHK
jgi:hypothetical protein